MRKRKEAYATFMKKEGRKDCDIYEKKEVRKDCGIYEKKGRSAAFMKL